MPALEQPDVDLVDHAAEIMRLLAGGTKPGRAVMEAVRAHIFHDHVDTELTENQ